MARYVVRFCAGVALLALSASFWIALTIWIIAG